MVHYRLTYFDGRDKGETARQILAFAGVPFDDVRVTEEEWPAIKPSTPFGQMPVLEVDGKALAQSHAINRYLARQFGLAGSNEWESAQIDALSDGMDEMRKYLEHNWTSWAGGQLLEHLRKTYHGLVFDRSPAEKQEWLKKAMEEFFKPRLQRFETFLLENRTGYFVDSKISSFDIEFAETLSQFEELMPGILGHFKELSEFVTKIHSHPNLKKWIENRPKIDW